MNWGEGWVRWLCAGRGEIAVARVGIAELGYGFLPAQE